VSIGSYKPAMRELPEALFRRLEKVYIDTEHAPAESGDLCVPLEKGCVKRDQVSTLGRLIIEGGANDEARSATSLFKSVGMALFDVCVSRLIYERALEKGLEQEIKL